MKYRVGATTKSGKIISENFTTRDEATIWLLDLMNKEEVTHYKIIDRETKELLETENKQYDKGETK